MFSQVYTTLQPKCTCYHQSSVNSQIAM